ncbi:hypothetical protein pdam_00000204 [Pocillopora damicornis]|uniref:Cyclin N-terminal domain-containing protein n=1 Tax=Pocillopora damicornis TaxID=46731 RepID=A0A3M6UX05_POCDA|nr:hypothetical protein pdam_00000204 [Pocillopora damicornis]
MAAVGRMNVIRHDQENENLLAGKAKISKNTRPRAALGDLGNKPTALTSKTAANLAVGAKPKRTLHRTEGTSGLLSKQAKDNETKQQKKTIDMGVVSEALESCMFATKPSDVIDIDKDDHSNPQLCAEYAQEIYQYMHQLEIYDPTKEELQLIGVSAMLLACKYEEMYCPEISDFVYITDNTYKKGQIRKMEGVIFKQLEFSVGKPLCLHFLRRNSKAGEVDGVKHTMAKYFMELSLVDYGCMKFLPSEIAAAALYIAMKADDGSEWTPTCEYYSMYSESKLLPCARRLASLITKTLDGSARLKAVYNKYSTSKFMEISKRPCLTSSFVTNLAAEDLQQ